MRRAALFVAGWLSTLLWAEPFGPWQPAAIPPAALAAGPTVVIGADTLTLVAFAWRDYMPKIVSGCGGSAGTGHPLRMIVSLRSSAQPVSAPSIDSLWLVHPSRVLLDVAPRWAAASHPPHLRYDSMPEYRVGDSLTVLVASGAFPAGQRHRAAGCRIIATM